MINNETIASKVSQFCFERNQNSPKQNYTTYLIEKIMLPPGTLQYTPIEMEEAILKYLNEHDINFEDCEI